MGLLTGKKILITGVLNRRSIAFGIACVAYREGAEIALTHQAGDKFKKRLEEIVAEDFPNSIVLPCDLTSDVDINETMGALQNTWGHLDGIVHSAAYAQRETLSGDYHETVNRAAFAEANDISAYSLSALVKAAVPLMANRQASVITMTYLGAIRAIPNYNLMGVAKATLEANMRYLAFSAGPLGVRVNAISAGPVKTLAASGISGFGKILAFVEQNSPLRKNITIEDIGEVALFLLSPMSRMITGEVIYVDGGYHLVGMPISGDAS